MRWQILGRPKYSEVIVDGMKQDTSEDALLDQMLMTLKKLDKIAVLKEEDFVIRKLLRGVPRKNILEELQKNHPNEKLSMGDLNEFIKLYRNPILKQQEDIQKSYVRRLVKSKEGLNNELIDLAVKSKNMVDDFREEKDNTNAVAALRTAADIFMKFAKVEGLTTDTPEVQVNVQMDSIVSKLTSGSNNVSSRLKTMFEDDDAIEAEYEVKDGKSDSQ